MNPRAITEAERAAFGADATIKVWGSPEGMGLPPAMAVHWTVDGGQMDGAEIASVVIEPTQEERELIAQGADIVIGWYGGVVPVFPIPVVIYDQESSEE